MATKIFMPQLGLTMTEGTITKWFKQVGDRVQAGEALVEIETDKINNELESPCDGVLLKVLAGKGETFPVKALLAVIGEPGEKIQDGESADNGGSITKREEKEEILCSGQEQEANAEINKPRQPGERLKTSPAARKLAAERNINLSMVTGTGPGGRITEKDVLNFKAPAAGPSRVTPLAAKIAMEHGIHLEELKKESRITRDDVLAIAEQAAALQPLQPVEAEGIPLTGIRKVIAERMSMSWQAAPHVTLTVETDLTTLKYVKEKMASSGIKASYTEFIVKAVAAALMENKEVNRSLIGGRIKQYDTANIGVAVAMDNGLIVPVVRNAQHKSVMAIREEISALSEKARKGVLGPDEMSGGTFTVTNLGMYGIDSFTPIINPPESAILGVGRLVERPAVSNDAVIIKPFMNLCLSIDHRLIDGAPGAKFLGRVKELLENPYLLF